ncbi:sodium:alanine symporter family protein [bacterium]|jgi:alanine or glycine:cation symporter, AGCS family|nr:sodium:alanine symporter family protein [bacterium]MBT3903846.1 sodium:alanine symporter family protein [bacterium]MBT6529103.1 sodium:alanine symporter family protein [bacterium]
MLSFMSNLVCIVNDYVWGWPMVIGALATGTILTIALGFVQFRSFFTAWKMAIFSDSDTAEGTDISPFQAFINALGTSLGNGGLAGTATAIHLGGPGAAIWMFIFGFLCMAFRYIEVYISIGLVGQQTKGPNSIGGPMEYFKRLPGSFILPSLYALLCLFYSLASGNALQCNSVRFGVESILSRAGFSGALAYSTYAIAFLLFAFVVYLMVGGAARILRISDRLVPLKVGLFVLSASIVLIYNWAALLPALKLMILSAFTPKAVGGAALGSSIRYGIARTLNANEAGLGIAGVLYGASGSKRPVQDSIASMLSTFISTHVMTFAVALCIVSSGVWNNGMTGIDLDIAAFSSAFGWVGALVVTTLSVMFGIGVLVSYGYIARRCWLFLTGGRFSTLFSILYCCIAFFGTIIQVKTLFCVCDLVNAGMFVIVMYASFAFLPELRAGLRKYRSRV